MVLSATQKYEILNNINKYIPDEAMASQDYTRLASEFERLATQAQMPPLVHDIKLGYYGMGDMNGASILRAAAGTLRLMASQEAQHKQYLETMRTQVNSLKTS